MNTESNPYRSNIIRVFEHLRPIDKKRLTALLFLILFSGFLEILTLGSVVPFMLAISNSNEILNDGRYSYFLDLIGVKNEFQLILSASVIFSICIIASSLMRLTITKLNFMWCYELIAELSITMFKKTIHQKLLIHTHRNSSEIISGITLKSGNLLNFLILPAMSMIQAVFLSSAVVISLFYILPLSNLMVLFLFGVGYFIITLFLRKILVRNSQTIALLQTKSVNAIQESLKGIKNMILSNNHNFYIKSFSDVERPYRAKGGQNAYFLIFPRYLIEGLGMIVIIFIILVNLLNSENPTDILPSIGVLALASQRLLPYLQQIYAAYSATKSSSQIIIDALDLLEQRISETSYYDSKKELKFEKEIELKNVSFNYPESDKQVLKDISLKIKKNSMIGIIGTTGSGKTTFIDMLMGLIDPSDGELLVDGYPLKSGNLSEWYKKILHVPQEIFISDSTILENIALGVDKNKIDMNRVKDSAKKAQLEDFILSLPLKYESKTGEIGNMMSGGQKQRLGIARSFYKGGELLILDEGTNALDMKTERNIIENIKDAKKEMTIVIVAHNLDTIKNCDQIIVLDEGRISEIGTFKDIEKTKAYNNIAGEI